MSIDQGGPKYALGIDFGTSNTVAVARWPDGRARPILVDGSPLLPSAVFAEPEGTLLVGRDAVHSARLEPARFEPNPKRRVDDGLVLLGEQEFDVVDLITAVLARVVEEWHRAVGPYRPETTLTCPATWGAARRTLLAEAAARAGLSGVRLVAEPVAAATYFAEVLGREVPIGSVLMVHDFGAGTFDASLVARTATGFEVLAVDGRDDLGGLDVDAALVEHLRTDDWQRLLEPSTVEERRARRQLWDDVRIAKERLSRAQSADFVVPLLDTEVHLTRDELEQVARPVLEQTVRITRNLLAFADLPAGRLAGVFLVGGASRIPLVATLLHRELGEPPVVIEQPELVVAEGSILAGAALLASEPAAPGPTAELRLPSRSLPEFGEPTPVPRSHHSDRSDLPVMTQPVAAQSIPEAAGSALPAHAPGGTAETPPVPGAAEPRPVPGAAAEPRPVPGAAETLPARGPGATGETPPEHGPGPAGGPLPARVPGAAAGPLAARTPGAAAGSLPEREAEPADRSLDHGTPRPAGAGEPATTAEPHVDNRETEIRPELVVPPHMRPPVDPWPDAEPPHWRHDPDATMPTSPPRHEVRTPGVREKQSRPETAPNRPANPVVAHARPVSPVTGQARPVSGRAVVAAPRPPSVPQQPRPAPKPAPEQQSTRRPKRRKSRLLRFFQLLLALLTMICVPMAALVAAYGYGKPGTWQQDAVNVFRDIASLVHS
ncbi:Hsp70 family protein [Actinoplanes oblitus]|uniref:Hsp70 family protein n=1 Tax=Actinoplanes oblitus TaxID=3040509 RepID=A0ABY8WES3_9ACTN|nr:Hsp70 family protein [Actinoplanes oblitus]WIM95568.1 Hsp70 family protein [Actinoplanes oblitus]